MAGIENYKDDSMNLMIVQVEKPHVPRKKGSIGSLVAVNADGFYGSRDFAIHPTKGMAEERPDLETYLVKVIARVHP